MAILEEADYVSGGYGIVALPSQIIGRSGSNLTLGL